jgi:HlyD family secretion protein
MITFSSTTNLLKTTLRPILIFTVALLLFAGCSSEENSRNQRGRSLPTPTVEAVLAQYGSLPLEERLSGSVKAYNQMQIFPEITSPITQVLVNNGDRVRAGQEIVRLRDFEARERVKQAEASLMIASAQVRQSEARLSQISNQLERVRQLAERDLQSQAELEQLQAEVMSAEATNQLNLAQKSQAESILEERKNALDLTIIKAPISGIVGQRNAEVGQLAAPNNSLFSIGDLDRMRVEVTLTEQMLSRVKEGMRVHLTSSAIGDTVITSTVTRISPFLDPITHTATTEIEVRNVNNLLRPGMFVNVDIFYGDSDQATLVPNNAIYRHPREGFEGIFVAASLGQELNFEYSEDQEIPQIVGPTPIEFRRVDIVARGRSVSAVRGIEPQTYIVTLGQNLMIDGSPEARIRRVGWEHILNLQQLQSRDLIRILQQQRNDSSVTL